MKTIALALSIAGFSTLLLAASASAQVFVERQVIYGADPLNLSIDRLLGPDVLTAPAGIRERVMSAPAVIDTAPATDQIYVPGIYVPGRYSHVNDLNSIVLPFTNW